MKGDLSRSLGFFEFLCLGINCVVGTGIFLLPSLVCGRLGPSGAIAYILCGALCLLIGLCFCEMAGRFEGTGGAYLYARSTFGPFMGYLVGWQIWLSSLVGWASVAKGFYIYWQQLTPFSFKYQEPCVIFLLIFVLSVLNYRGVRQGSMANNFFALSKLVPLFIFIAAGLFFIKADNFAPFFKGTPQDWGAAMIIVLYAFSGFEEIPLPAGEGVDSRKVVPRALLSVLMGAALVYVLIQVVAVGVYPNLASSPRPLVDAAQQVFGCRGAVFMAVGGLLSIGGINSSIALTGPRALYALARGGYLPAWLEAVHETYHTPWRAIIVNSTLTCVLALSGTFESLLKLSVLAALWQYTPTCMAALVMKLRKTPSEFNSPGGLAVPVLALVLCGALIAQIDLASICWSLAGTAIGLTFYIFYLLFRRKDSDIMEDEVEESAASAGSRQLTDGEDPRADGAVPAERSQYAPRQKDEGEA